MLLLDASWRLIGFFLILLIYKRLQPILFLDGLVYDSTATLQFDYLAHQVAVNKVSTSRVIKLLLLGAILIADSLVDHLHAAVAHGWVVALLLVQHVDADEIRVLFFAFV